MTLATPIVHHPFAFSLGPIPLTGFGIAVLAAFLIAQIIAERELARRGQDREAQAVPDLIMAAVIGTLVGAKVYYVTVITHNFGDLWSRGGFVFWGGFIGAVAACALVIRYKRLAFLRFADVGAIAIAAGYSIGRTGCWAVGDDYGKPWSGFLAVSFPQGAPPSTVLNMSREFAVAFPRGMDPSTVVSVYPTQLFEVALGFIMFLILWRLRTHRHAVGWLFGVYCALAGVERFIIEFFRAKDDRTPLAGLSLAQLISVGAVAVGFGIMAARRGRTGEAAPSPAIS